jgi:uncharacterized protein (TIGR03083 family)
MTDGHLAGIDYASAYRELRERVTELLRTQSDAQLDATAPATPEWRVRDVAAHLAGVCDDVSHGNMDGVASDEWTGAQVAKRRDWPVDQLLDDWQEHAATVEAIMNDLGPAIGQMLADAATHEQDIRGALDAPGARESDALIIGFEWGMGTIGERLQREQQGTLQIEHEAGTSTLGADDPVTHLRATRFEVARSMAGRRSRAQMEAYGWEGPLGPDDILLATFFTPPARDLVE